MLNRIVACFIFGKQRPDFSLHLSLDGMDWGDAVVTGSFEKSIRTPPCNPETLEEAVTAVIEKEINGAPGLSSQNGSDFAAGAEFSVIAD